MALPYPMKCGSCGWTFVERLAPDDPAVSGGVTCAWCLGTAVQDWAVKLHSVQVETKTFWHNTASDFEPAGLRGADRSSEVRRTYRDETREPQRVTTNRTRFTYDKGA